MDVKNVSILRRNVHSIVIPFGDEVELEAGSEVLVTQDKGGSFTVNFKGNLYHISAKDADALGREPLKFPIDGLNIKAGDDIKLDVIWEQLGTVYDPEIPSSIVELGLIYDIQAEKLENKNYHIIIEMTLTSAGCGMGPVLVKEVEEMIMMFPNVDKVDVILVFDPPWDTSRLTDEAKLELGLF